MYGPEEKIELPPWRYGMMRTVDGNGRLVALFSSEHELNFYSNKYPEITFLEQPKVATNE